MMNKLILVSTIFLFNSMAFSQWAFNEVANNLQLSATLSVEIVDEKVIVGGVCGTTASQIDHLNMIQSTDAGQTWAQPHTSTIGSEYLYTRNLHFFDDQVGLATCTAYPGYYAESSDDQFIIKTVDGGVTWNSVYQKDASHGFEAMSAMEFFDGTNGIVAGHFDDAGWFDIQPWMAVTSNGGDSWTDINLPAAMDGKEIKGMDIEGNAAYILLQDGYDYVDINNSLSFYVYKSTDLGQTWTQISTMPFPQEYAIEDVLDGSSATDIDFGSADVGYICFAEAKHKSYVYKTTDGGNTWSDIQAPLNSVSGHANLDFNDIHFTSANEGFVAAGNYCDENACYRGYGVIYTADGGANWTVIGYDPNASFSFTKVDYDPTVGVGYIVGSGITSTNGRVFKLEHPNAGQEELDEIEFDMYPNPSNGVVYIDGLPEGEIVEILSLDGKKIKDVHSLNGSLEIVLDNGIYLVRSGSATKKLTVTK